MARHLKASNGIAVASAERVVQGKRVASAHARVVLVRIERPLDVAWFSLHLQSPV